MNRRWDEYDVYLFDLDGTLLHCFDAVQYFAFCEVLTAIANKPVNLDGVTAHGNVDLGILRDALTLAGLPASAWTHRIPEMCDRLGSLVRQNQSEMRVQALPGAIPILTHLRRKGARLGVATGNLEEIGWLKLEAGELRSYFHFGCFSDGCEYRHQVVRRAVAEAQRNVHSQPSICMVGDTPEDVRAAKMHNVDVIAVASGIFCKQDLLREQPDLLLASLEELLPSRHFSEGHSETGESTTF